MKLSRNLGARLRSAGALLFSLYLLISVPSTAWAAGPNLPSSMDGLGDSITRGFNTCGWFFDCTSRSWSTGNYGPVNSHYLRILAKNKAIQGKNFNDAQSGATVANLNSQAALAVARKVEYVTILIGANDACTSSVSSMTPVLTFQTQLATALQTLKKGLPNARVLVSSIPNAYQLWSIGHTSFAAVATWEAYQICHSMLANPTSTSAADEARRQQVRQRIEDFNFALQQACTDYGALCKFDGNAVFNYKFALNQVSTWDYFHPNVTGQAKLASLTYAAGFNW